MGLFVRASRAGRGNLRIEGPTWLALAGCYGMWGVFLAHVPEWGLVTAPFLALLAAFHSSLTHEVCHGHPTRSALLNEALVFVPLGVFIPYRRFRDLHLRHHNDSRLTDPYDDPESFYHDIRDWRGRWSLARALLLWNGTFLGRMIVGPGLSLWGFYSTEWCVVREGDRAAMGAWFRHGLGLLGLGGLLWMMGVSPVFYVLAVAYPAMSLIMVRSFIEHRAAENAGERTAIVDANWFWRLLFLNNNYHAVHHAYPSLAWYRLGARWQKERERVLAQNGGYYLPGYLAVMRQWLLRRREPLVHPFVGHDGTETQR